MKIRCPGCSKILNVADSLQGKRIKCPACKAAIQVKPADGEIEILPIEAGTSHGAQPPARPEAGARPGASGPQAPPFCPQCQTPLQKGAVICTRCGTNVITLERLPGMVHPSRPRSRFLQMPLKYLVPAVFFALVAGAGYFGYRRIRGLAQELKEEKDAEVERGPTLPEMKRKPKPQVKVKAEPKPPPKKTPPPPKPKPVEAAKPRVGPGEIPERARAQFEEALAKLGDPVEKPIAMSKIRNLGAFAPRLLIEAVDEEEDPLVRRGIAEVMQALRNEAVVPGLVLLLEDSDDSVRQAAVGAMSTYRGKAIEFCTDLLSSENEFARASSLAVFAKMRHTPASDRAIELLRDPSDLVKIEAARALGGGLYPGSLASIDDLLQLLRHDDMDVAEAAAKAVARDSSKASLAIAMDLGKAEPSSSYFNSYVILRSRKPKARAQLASVLALAAGKEGAKYGKPLLVGTGLGRSSALDAALIMAPTLGSKLSPFLACCAADPNPRLRAKVMKALKRIPDKWSRFALAVSLGDPETTVADLAAEALVSAASTDQSMVRRAAESRNRQRAILAAAVLVAQGDNASLDTLSTALTDMSLPTVVRGKAAWFLALAGKKDMLGLFEEAAIDVRREETERLYSAAAAVKLGAGEEYLSVLQKAASTGSVATRLLAIDLLGRTGEKKAGPFLIKLMRMETPQIQHACAQALGRIADPRLAKDIVESFALINERVVPDLIDALEPIKGDAQKYLMRLLYHENKAVRRAAIVAVGKLQYAGAADRLVTLLRENEGKKWITGKIIEGLQMATGTMDENPDWRYWRWVLHKNERLDPSLVPLLKKPVTGYDVLQPKRWHPTKVKGELMSKTLPGNPSYKLLTEHYQLRGRPPPFASAVSYASKLKGQIAGNRNLKVIPTGAHSFDVQDVKLKRYYKVICFAELPRGRGVQATYHNLTLGCDKDLYSYNSKLFKKILNSFIRRRP